MQNIEKNNKEQSYDTKILRGSSLYRVGFKLD